MPDTRGSYIRHNHSFDSYPGGRMMAQGETLGAGDHCPSGFLGGSEGIWMSSPLPHTPHMYPAGDLDVVARGGERIARCPSIRALRPVVGAYRIRPICTRLPDHSPLSGRLDGVCDTPLHDPFGWRDYSPLRGYASPSLPTVKEAGSQRACTPTNPCG